MRKLFKMPVMLLTVLSIVIVSCAGEPIKIYDREYCADLGPEGAECVHTLLKKKRSVSKPQWDIERIGMMCSDSRVFTDTETVIDTVCSRFPCDFQERQKVDAVLTKIRPTVAKAKKARKKHFYAIQGANPDSAPPEE